MKAPSDPIVRDLEIMSEALNYRKWLFGHIAPFIGHRVIEVGAGLGAYTSLLVDREAVIAIDLHMPCFLNLRKRFAQYPHITPICCDIAGPPITHLHAFCPDTVLAVNVLEHIRNDMKAIANMYDYLVTPGRLILIVPAYNSIYGTIDESVGHVRRYGKSELALKLAVAGLRITEMRYLNSLAVPAWFLNGRVLKRTAESPRQVRIYDRLVVPWLSKIEGILPPPFGLSIMAVAEKR